MIRGTCQYCGCTEQSACEGGCAWTDDEQTLCTTCAMYVDLTMVYIAALEQAGRLPVVDWDERPLDERRSLVMITSAVFAHLRTSLVDALQFIADGEAADGQSRIVLAES